MGGAVRTATLAVVVGLLIACGGGGSSDVEGAGESPGSHGVASSCPCREDLVCAVDACWERCGAGGTCKSGFVCSKQEACIMLEAYPLPDGEVVRRGLAGRFTRFQVSGDWLFLVGSVESGRLGLFAAKLGSTAGLELRAELAFNSGCGDEPSSIANVIVRDGKVYYADGAGHAFVSAVEPWDPKRIPVEPFHDMIPSPARDTLVFLGGNRFTVQGLSTTTGEVLGPAHEVTNVGLLLAPEARSALVVRGSDPYSGKRDLTRVDLVTGALSSLGISGELSGAGYPLKDSSFGSAWVFGSYLVLKNDAQSYLSLLDTSKPGGEERGLGTAMDHVGVDADGFYAVAPSGRGRDLVHIAVPSGAVTSLGWLRSRLQASWAYRPRIVVDGPWVYALDLDAVEYPGNSNLASGWVYRFRR